MRRWPARARRGLQAGGRNPGRGRQRHGCPASRRLWSYLVDVHRTGLKNRGVTDQNLASGERCEASSSCVPCRASAAVSTAGSSVTIGDMREIDTSDVRR